MHKRVNQEQSALILKIFLVLFQTKFSQSGSNIYCRIFINFFHLHWGNELLHCNCYLEMLFHGSLILLQLPNLRRQYVIQNNFYSQVISHKCLKNLILQQFVPGKLNCLILHQNCLTFLVVLSNMNSDSMRCREWVGDLLGKAVQHFQAFWCLAKPYCMRG